MGDCSFLCSLRSFQPWSTRDLVVPLFDSYDAKVQPFFFSRFTRVPRDDHHFRRGTKRDCYLV